MPEHLTAGVHGTFRPLINQLPAAQTLGNVTKRFDSYDNAAAARRLSPDLFPVYVDNLISSPD